MDIFEQWKKIEEEKFTHSPIKKEEIMEAIYQKSTGSMEILKTRLKYKMVWVLFFTGVFTGLMLWQIANIPAAIIFALAALSYGLGYLGLRRYYKKMGSDRKVGTTIEVMKDNYDLITGALKFESNMFLAILPAMIIGAVLVPSLIGGENIVEIISEPKTLIVVAIAIVVFGPLVKIMGDKMNKIAYGEFIGKLESNIKEMEKVG